MSDSGDKSVRDTADVVPVDRVATDPSCAPASKRSAAFVRGLLRRMTTPEFRKRAAVCLFMLFLLLCECIAFFFSKSEIRSIVRPFAKGVWLYLALFGLSLIPGGRITRIMLSFWVLLMGVVTAVGVFMYMRFALPLSSDSFFVLAASSGTEVKEFLSRFLTWKLVLILLGFFSVCGGVIALVWRTAYQRSYLNVAVAVALMLPYVVISAFYIVSGKSYLIYTRSNLPRLVFGYFAYRKGYSKMVELAKAPQLPSGIRSLAERKKMLGVLVIGESANSNHWGVYGYSRDTTPQIRKRLDRCLIYDDVVAPIPSTCRSFYYMFTDVELRSRHTRKHRMRFTFIDVLKAAGWRVVLISNQNRWGHNDSPIGILTAHCDRRVYMFEKMKYPFDQDILPELDEELRNDSAEPLLVILHLIGSHNEFSSRCPKEFSRFVGVRDECTSGLGDEQIRELGEYDDSIAYTDRVLGGILERMERLSVPAFMLYCSDHGESGRWKGYRYARSEAVPIPELYEIPFLLWTNDEYRREFPQFMARAARNLHAPMQTDRLIWSVISAAQVTFDGFPREMDIFSGGDYRPARQRLMRYRIPYYPSADKRKLRNVSGKE